MKLYLVFPVCYEVYSRLPCLLRLNNDPPRRPAPEPMTSLSRRPDLVPMTSFLYCPSIPLALRPPDLEPRTSVSYRVLMPVLSMPLSRRSFMPVLRPSPRLDDPRRVLPMEPPRLPVFRPDRRLKSVS